MRKPERNSLAKSKTKLEGFTDTFKKFTSQQPAMADAMTMAPGVQLTERGHVRRGADDVANRPNHTMSRREYQDMVDSGKGAAQMEISRISSSKELPSSGA